MNQTLIIVLFLYFISCNSHTEEKETAVDNNNKHDSLPLNKESINNKSINESKVSERLMILVKQIDSAGYSFDTLKTYRQNRNYKTFLFSNYRFYDIEYIQTLPYSYIQMIKNDTSILNNLFYQKFSLNPKSFEKVERIVGYFFSSKTPLIRSNDKWFIDGMVEEWRFPDNKSAKQASEELSLNGNQSIVYNNCGAFVCFVDNYMYLMHTRASLFMSYIKPFFKRFVEENKAIITSVEIFKLY